MGRIVTLKPITLKYRWLSITVGGHPIRHMPMMRASARLRNVLNAPMAFERCPRLPGAVIGGRWRGERSVVQATVSCRGPPIWGPAARTRLCRAEIAPERDLLHIGPGLSRIKPWRDNESGSRATSRHSSTAEPECIRDAASPTSISVHCVVGSADKSRVFPLINRRCCCVSSACERICRSWNRTPSLIGRHGGPASSNRNMDLTSKSNRPRLTSPLWRSRDPGPPLSVSIL